MRNIRLSNGMIAIIDDEDFDALSIWSWHYKPSGLTGYAYRNAPRGSAGPRTPKMHQVVLAVRPGECVDHINGDGLDNRRGNLRVAVGNQNNANRKKSLKKASSRFKGVNWDPNRGKWLAYVRVNRKMKNLGRYILEEDAAKVYNAAAIEYFGEYAKLNEISG